MRLSQELGIKLFCIGLIPVIGFISPLICVAMVFVACFYLMVENDSKTLIYFISFSLIQNLTLLVCANRFEKMTMTLFSLSKEIMIYGCVAFSILRIKRWKKIERYTIIFIVFLITLAGAFMISDANIYPKVISIRQMMLPFICFYFGKKVDISDCKYKDTCRYIINTCVFAAFFGIMETFILKDDFWKIFSAYQYQVNKGTAFRLYNGMPSNFYTWDYIDFFNAALRRLVSIFVNPLVTGHYLFFGYVLADVVLKKGLKKFLMKSLLLITALLTLSKGVYISVLVYMVMKCIKNRSYRTITTLILTGMLSITVGIGFIYEIVQRFFPTSSTYIHVRGLIQGLRGSGWIGNGLGKAGVVTNVLSNLEENLAGESYVGVLTVQMGYIGLIIFLAFFLKVIIQLIKMYKETMSEMTYAMAALLLCVIIESFFSESSIAIIGTGIYFVISGVVYGRKRIFKPIEPISENINHLCKLNIEINTENQ